MTAKNSIFRMWINQPSTLQEFHGLHGKNVLAILPADEHEFCEVWFTDGYLINQKIRRSALAHGWNGPGKW